MKFAIFGIAALLFVLCPNTTATTTKIRLCGRMLAEALSLLCSGYYYEPQQEIHQQGIEKRSVPAPRLGSVSNWLMSQRPSKMDLYRSRQTRGVVDECCTNACSPTSLVAYCA